MNIIYASNNAYSQYLGISILSLFDNNQDLEQIDVYILSENIDNTNIKHLNSIASKYNRHLHFIDITEYKKKISFDFDTSGYNPITLSRLFLCEYIPEDVDRILYLDCDIIVSGSIKELENIPLGNNLVAAVPELHMPPEKKAIVGIKRDECYYNAGVLLVNLALWRKESIENTFMCYYKAMDGCLLYNDQDIINHCCKGRITTLSHTYNLSPNIFYFPRYFVKSLQPFYKTEPREEYKSILKKPSIIHYMGDERPWIEGNHNKYRQYYEYYWKMSPWKDVPQIPGQKLYMWCYHTLNVITLICPWFRILFSKLIGINKYKWFSKD